MEANSDLLANDSCEARQADDIMIPKQVIFGVDCHQFLFSFKINFIRPPTFPVEDEDDYLLVVPEIVSRTSYHRVWIPCRFLKNDNLSWKDTSVLLTEFGVPIHKQPLILHRISVCADEMAGKDCNRGRRVLPISVSIKVVEDYYVSQPGDGRITYKEAKQFSRLKAEPASDSLILSSLFKKTIQEAGGGGGQCMVCLEKFQAGLEAQRMPCGHVFHESCIFNWLRAAGFCPRCHSCLRMCRTHICIARP